MAKLGKRSSPISVGLLARLLLICEQLLGITQNGAIA